MGKGLHLIGQHLLIVPTTLQVESIHIAFITFNVDIKIHFLKFIAPIDSYQLVYSTSPNDIIDEDGFIDERMVSVNYETDVISVEIIIQPTTVINAELLLSLISRDLISESYILN